MFHNIDAETDLLRYAVSSVESCTSFFRDTSETLFEDPRSRNLYKAVGHYFLTYKGLLDLASFERLLDLSQVDPTKKTTLLSFFSQVLVRPLIAEDKAILTTELLRDLFLKRAVYDQILEVGKNALQGGKSGREVIETLATQIYNIVPNTHPGIKEARLVDGLDGVIASYVDRKTNPGRYKGVPFGLSALDNRTSGMFKGELGLFFGRTGAGKSRVMVNVAANAAECGYRVMYVTIEMPLEQIVRLVAARNLIISYEGLRKGNLRPDEETLLLQQGKETLSKMPGDVYIVDVPQGCTASTIAAGIRKYKQMHGQLDLVVVDYLNLMHLPNSARMGRPEMLGMLSQQLKELARLENVPVLTAAQANRSTLEKEDISEVGTAQISWSDIIPANCDLIVYFEQSSAAEGLDPSIDAVIVKYRDGAGEVAKLGVDWDHNFIGDLDKLAARFQSRQPALNAFPPRDPIST